jgi:hypothetical protein
MSANMQSKCWYIKFLMELCFLFDKLKVDPSIAIEQLVNSNLSMKEGSLFCFVLEIWDTPNRDALDHVLGVFGNLLTRRGAWAWFPDILICNAKVVEHWMISSLKIKLNCSWKFRRNWNVPLVLLERSWWAGFNGIYLVSFGFRMWEVLIFKWCLVLKIQINPKNQVLKGKISWECGNIWRVTIQFKHDFLSYLAVQKINTYCCGQQLTQKLKITLEASELEPITQQLTQNWK